VYSGGLSPRIREESEPGLIGKGSTRAQREELQAAHFDMFLLYADDVLIDLLTGGVRSVEVGALMFARAAQVDPARVPLRAVPRASTTSLKLDPKTKERVQRLASVRRRTPHWILREAVEQYVEREEKRERLREDALAAWNHYQETGLHVTGSEADAWLAKLEAGKRATPPKCHD
jgi:predicted transcriptional regulator